MTSADSLPEHALYSITDLDGKVKGSIEMSLWRNTQRGAIKQIKLIDGDHLTGISNREGRLQQRPNTEGEENGHGTAQTDIGPSGTATASKPNELAEADDKKVERSVQCQEDRESIIKEPASKEIVQITVRALKLTIPMRRKPSETRTVSFDFVCLLPGHMVTCSLEKEAAVEFRSAVVCVADRASGSLPVSFQHAFMVPEERRGEWFDQSLIFKVQQHATCRQCIYLCTQVLSVSESGRTEGTDGEMHLEMSCLLRFGRVCGPMGILNSQLQKTGELEIDVQLLDAEAQILADTCARRDPQGGITEKTSGATIPLQTCSDDENYVVVGGIDDLSPRSDNIDALCDLLMQSTDLDRLHHSVTEYSAPATAAAVCDPFYCDDDFMLDISKTADLIAETEDVTHRDAPMDDRVTELPIDSADGEASDDSVFDTEGDISVQRVSSDCLRSKDSKEKWHFTTALPMSPSSSPILYSDVPAGHSMHLEDARDLHHPSCTEHSLEELMHQPSETARDDDAAVSDGSDSKDSVDIDDLLKKYNVERRPGWWRSLVSETPPTEDAE